jgi:hypothetical protein
VVAHSRAPLGAHTLRTLNGARDLAVRSDTSGKPVAVRRSGWTEPRPVRDIRDCWRIDDEWWRERPVSRIYYELLMDDGLLLTVYHDLVADRWLEQRG